MLYTGWLDGVELTLPELDFTACHAYVRDKALAENATTAEVRDLLGNVLWSMEVV